MEMRTWINQKRYKQIKMREKKKLDICKLRSVKAQTQFQEGPIQEKELSALKQSLEGKHMTLNSPPEPGKRKNILRMTCTN